PSWRSRSASTAPPSSLPSTIRRSRIACAAKPRRPWRAASSAHPSSSSMASPSGVMTVWSTSTAGWLPADGNVPMTESFTDAVRFHWQRRRGEIIDHFRRLWAAPELPMMESQAAVGLSNWLERHGFAVERGVGGLPTAFRASYGRQPGAAIGLLAEYDALPGLANEAVPRRAQPG